ncbi:MAG: ergothioneine biosynthesis protein EgtB [Chlorobiota bacterium]
MNKHLPLYSNYISIRQTTLNLCKPLIEEDYITQTEWFVSPPKWHLAHTTWFFETFILVPYSKDYKVYDERFSYLFNSYYFSKGDRLTKSDRGVLARPRLNKVIDYRSYVDSAIQNLLENCDQSDYSKIESLMNIGVNHEQQHQELLLMDIKYNYASSSYMPNYADPNLDFDTDIFHQEFLKVDEGVYTIGFQGDSFHFDNEGPQHKQYIHDCYISNRLVTNREYLGFITDGGYNEPLLWLSDGWEWKEKHRINHPLYWKLDDDNCQYFTLHGMRELDPSAPVSHLSFYEANAFARWAGYRLPTEFEWEVACGKYNDDDLDKAHLLGDKLLALPNTASPQCIGNLWVWTESSYSPYPNYVQSKGALGEYNGKFMINQKVLRGGSFSTPRNHIRPTYRNFYHPESRWCFNGIRLAKNND